MRRARRATALALLLVATSCGRGHDKSTGAPAGQPESDTGAGATGGSGMPMRNVTILWPSSAAQGLVATNGEIFATSSAVDQIKQVIGILLHDPPRDGLAAPLPKGTALQDAFLDAGGTAYVSFSHDLVAKAPGGSDWEILAVNSLAGSIMRSVPRVKRVQILVDGKEIESITGHLDLRGPQRLDPSLVIGQ